MRVPFAAALLVACLLAGALPLAAADHVYSHRYVLWGRVVDAQDRPVAGVPIVPSFPEELGYEGFCAPSTANETVTAEDGSFYLCNHVHVLDEGATFSLLVGERNLTVPMNLDQRRSALEVRLDESPGNATADLAAYRTRYLVTGVLWEPGGRLPTALERVPVAGTTLEGAEVRISLAYNDGRVAEATVFSDSYGNFAHTFVLDEPLASGRLVVDAGALGRFEEEADPVFMHTDAPLVLEAAKEARVQRVLLVLGAVGAAGVVGVGLAVRARRRA